LTNKIKSFSFDISIRESHEWQDYYKMLYPPAKEKQRYHNSIIIKRIAQERDNPENEREIDHAIFFDSSEAREKFLKELKKIKFPFEKFEQTEQKGIDLPYTLELKVLSPLKIDILNRSTDILISLAEKYHASYDGWVAEIKK